MPQRQANARRLSGAGAVPRLIGQAERARCSSLLAQRCWKALATEIRRGRAGALPASGPWPLTPPKTRYSGSTPEAYPASK